MQTFPPGTERLFSTGLPSADLPDERRELIEVLLENGDTTDLRHLFSEIDEAELRSWAEQFSAHRLSRRSQVFWSFVTGDTVFERDSFRESIWPL